MAKYIRHDRLPSHTVESLEAFLIAELDLKGPLKCGPQMLKYLVGLINGNFLSLDGLLACIESVPGIIEMEPNNPNHTITQRRDMLRRCRDRIIRDRNLDQSDSFKSRLIHLEESVEFLMKLHEDEIKEEFGEIKYSKRRIML